MMDGYSPDHDIPLSDIQKRPFAQYAEEHETASWQAVRVYVRLLHVQVEVECGRYRNKPTHTGVVGRTSVISESTNRIPRYGHSCQFSLSKF